MAVPCRCSVGGASSCGSATDDGYARGTCSNIPRECRGGNAAVHSEFSLGTYAKGQDEGHREAAVLQRTRWGQKGADTGARVCPESREEDGIAIVHEPKPKQYLITMRVAALCHEARDDAAPAQ